MGFEKVKICQMILIICIALFGSWTCMVLYHNFLDVKVTIVIGFLWLLFIFGIIIENRRKK